MPRTYTETTITKFALYPKQRKLYHNIYIMASNGSKTKTLSAILSLIKKAKRHGKKIVTTNGCFDILHVGHRRNLAFAKSLGDVLVIGVNSDSSVRALKGKTRPILPARERAELISAFESVDYVFIFNEKNPVAWLQKIKPHIHVKGSERRLEELLERKVVERNKGVIILAPYDKGHSTTEIIKRIIKKHSGH